MSFPAIPLPWRRPAVAVEDTELKRCAECGETDGKHQLDCDFNVFIDDLPEDERYLRLVEAGLHTGIVDVHPRPLTWVRDQPTVVGWRQVRKPGASEFAVVYVMADENGELVFGVSAIAFQPVAGSDLEWASCQIQTPR